jgi:hypothetical protein
MVWQKIRDNKHHLLGDEVSHGLLNDSVLIRGILMVKNYAV